MRSMENFRKKYHCDTDQEALNIEVKFICVQKKVDGVTNSTLSLASILVLTFRFGLQEAKGKLLWD